MKHWNCLIYSPRLRAAWVLFAALATAALLPAQSRPQNQLHGRKAVRPGGTLMNAAQSVAAHTPQVEFHVGAARFDLLRIPAGSFEIGSPPQEAGHEPGESPLRRIHISHAFYLGKYEVTQAQYQAVMGKVEPSNYHGGNYPVDGLPLTEARTFCEKLSHLTGLHAALPTEAQWEYACRAGTTTRYYTGDSVADLAKAGWFQDNSGEHLHEVGQKQPNAFGLYDMLGNVGEMCQDEVYNYAAMNATDPQGEVMSYRTALRGGAWMMSAEDCRCAAKSVANNEIPSQAQGFRIAVIP